MNRLRSRPLPAVQLRDALRSDLDALPDSELLDRFARYADHPAFEVLVRRHGPMVFGVCRRVLANCADADDAFQASFLVLIRKARSLHRADRLGPWLYGVACRVAMKARSREARRAAYRTEATDMIPDPTVPAEIPDWLPILDAELAALPAKYRDPLVLCELQGATRADAAKQLGVPEGTLSSRLARGRELLRKRLLKHGTLLPAGGLAALFTAGNVGRATAPAALLARTSDLAKVATGAAPAGAVPAGAARLTDEVLKGMFLTKLRVAAGTFALCALAVGLSAAAMAPADAPDEKGGAKAALAPKMVAPAAPELHVVKFADKGTVLPDRDAVQGLWVLEKCEASKGVRADEAREMKEMVGRMRFLVAGDVWWGTVGGPGGNVFPQSVVLDPTKNPKWVDLVPPDPDGAAFAKCIYELDGDRLRLCVANEGTAVRPAEFNTEADVPLMVMEFRRDKLLPAAGAKELLGSWRVPPQAVVDTDPKKGDYVIPPERVEVLDNFLFVYARPESSPNGHWLGGSYTIDATKNPKWIDVELVSPFEDDKQTKLYGSYEVADGRLKLALGKKRGTRPLEFKGAADVMVFDLSATKVPLAPGKPTVAPKPKPVPTEPAPKRPLGKDDGPVQRLIGSGHFAEAETLLRARLPQQTGLDAAEDRLLLGVCVFERARDVSTKPGDTPQRAPKLMTEALKLFDEAAEAAAGRPDDERAVRVRTQVDIRRLWALNGMGESDKVIATAVAVYERHQGAVEGLIALGVLYQAHKKRGDDERAAETRKRMTDVFAKLKDKPGAFPGTFGEYSRGYWEKEWFAVKP